MNRPAVRLGCVVAVMAVLVGVASLLSPSLTSAVEPVRPSRALLDNATLVCPESGYAKGSVSTDVDAVAAPAGVTADALGAGPLVRDSTALRSRLDLSALGTTKPFVTGQDRARVVSYAVRQPKVPPVVVSAEGKVAPGITAAQLTRSVKGPLRGLAEVPCTSSGSEFWFVGAGSQLGRHGRVYLTNTDSAAARVELQVYDEHGPLEDARARSLAIPAHKQVVVQLDQLAPTSQRLAVAVVTRQGRVAAALRDDALQGDTPVGFDWIPAAVRPAKAIVVPGVAPGAGQRILTIVAPGDSTASVDLSVLAPQGSFRPVKLGHLEVKPGTVTQVRLDGATQKQGAAIRLSSDAPVTASVRSDLGSGSGDHDVAYSSASRSLSGPAVVPVTTSGKGQSATLLLSTPSQRAVRVTAELAGTDGRSLGSSKVVVKPGSTVAVKLTPPKGTQRYVIVVRSDGGGPLYGTRLQVDESSPDGPMVSAWPLTSGVLTTVRPVSRSDLGTGIGVEESTDSVFN